jgi:UDP-N-acetylglucosamine 1-carboxyvinyltransferase
MGAKIKFAKPQVSDPHKFYNFNWQDHKRNSYQQILISGATPLHDAVLEVTDLRAGATLVLAALAATGTSVLHGIDHIDRGYEKFDLQLAKLGAKIKRESMKYD